MALSSLRSRLAGALKVWPGLVAALAALAVSQAGFWREVELSVFDRLVVAAAPGRADLPITIVGIDEPSFAEVGKQWPWPRRLHGRLLERLQEAGAAVVAFDVVFAEPSNAEDDLAFARAIRNHGAVVLAADLVYEENSKVKQWQRVEPLQQFRDAGAVPGFASVEIDADGVQRRVPVNGESFWSQVVRLLDQRLPDSVARFSASPDLLIHYQGGPHTFTYIPYYQLLEPEKYLSANWKEFLQDNVVLVGRNLKATTETRSAQADMFQTPFFHVGRELMPGVEIHANLVANMVAGDPLQEAPAAWTWLAWLAASLLAMALMADWRPWRSSLVAVGLMGALGVGEYLLLSRYLLWLPLGSAVLAVGLVYLAQGVAAYVGEQRQKRQIKQAFSMYVAPAVVEEMLAHPERLQLGGERRELTLLFTDLAGFTTISETLEPEEVARLLNRHLAEMTEIVLRYQGTVDKFIGDAVMAFWGAPFADPEQSFHAVAAAMEMQAKVAAMAEEIRAAGGPDLKMRIGIHRGECIVGNLGGENRFDYTAVGDAVNLASRLEGANKAYGTGILLSETVVEALAGRVPLRPVDKVMVKGKQKAIAIFTPCPEEDVAGLTGQAMAAYWQGDGAAAKKAWEALLAIRPDDPLAPLFLERLANLEAQGWPADWDGIARLESK